MPPPPPPRIPATRSLLALIETFNGRDVSSRAWRAPQLSSGYATAHSRAPAVAIGPKKPTVGQKRMRQWMKQNKKRFAWHTTGAPNYLGPGEDQPFPLNPEFRSEPVLSESARELIWNKVRRNSESLKAVSAELGVDVRRVAAVVRLKEVEKAWISEGKPLARPYARAVMAMLPQTNFAAGEENAQHEPINEVSVHSWSVQQLFVPTPESRHFTREHAAKAFHERLLSADARAPHPELIQYHRDVADGADPQEARARFEEAAMESERKVIEKHRRVEEWEKNRTKSIEGPRCEFRFKDINVDDVAGGRGKNATGWRYGAIYPDRKRGEVKIPTKVE